MPFQEDFANALNDFGITVDSSVIPSQDVLQNGLDSLSEWLSSLEDETRAAADEVTADFPVKFGLADAEVNIAPGLSDLLKAFDDLPASLSISTILDNCKTAFANIDGGN